MTTGQAVIVALALLLVALFVFALTRRQKVVQVPALPEHERQAQRERQLEAQRAEAVERDREATTAAQRADRWERFDAEEDQAAEQRRRAVERAAERARETADKQRAHVERLQRRAAEEEMAEVEARHRQLVQSERRRLARLAPDAAQQERQRIVDLPPGAWVEIDLANPVARRAVQPNCGDQEPGVDCGAYGVLLSASLVGEHGEPLAAQVRLLDRASGIVGGIPYSALRRCDYRDMTYLRAEGAA